MENNSSSVDWDTRFMKLAQYVGAWSKDRSRGVSAIIVDADNIVRQFGYNGFPRNINDDIEDRHSRPAKYLWTEHAERNAIYNAARIGVSVDDCKMYVPLFPCMDCARAIVQSGISTIVTSKPDFSDPNWGDQFKLTGQLFEETGIKVQWYEGDLKANKSTS